jgi:short-subunit dehydrogenase
MNDGDNVALRGRTCFLTGAAGGLGAEMARKLARVGCNLFLTSRNESALENLVAEILAMNADASVQFRACDLDDVAETRRLLEDALHRSGGIDILINNAGVFLTGQLMDCAVAELESILRINVLAPLVLAKAFIPGMVERGWGRILNVGSSSSFEGFANTVAYCASKHAILGMTRALHDELKGHNVRVSCVGPGSIKTEMGERVEGQEYSTFMESESVADAIVWMLAHDRVMNVRELRLDRFPGGGGGA